MREVARRESPPLADLFDWVDSSWPALAGRWRGASEMRVEDRMDDGKYVVRAEVPGVDPDKDLHVDVDNGTLTITAERRESRRGNGRSEFHYGSFRRQLSLPTGAQKRGVTARFENGILEITVPVDVERARTRSIPIAHGARGPEPDPAAEHAPSAAPGAADEEAGSTGQR